MSSVDALNVMGSTDLLFLGFDDSICKQISYYIIIYLIILKSRAYE